MAWKPPGGCVDGGDGDLRVEPPIVWGVSVAPCVLGGILEPGEPLPQRELVACVQRGTERSKVWSSPAELGV